jgi:hypothetical protein
MARRTKRLEHPPDRDAVLLALCECRRTVVSVLASTRIGCPAYCSAERALAAIDDLGAAVAGKPHPFDAPLHGAGGRAERTD